MKQTIDLVQQQSEYLRFPLYRETFKIGIPMPFKDNLTKISWGLFKVFQCGKLQFL
jgi:hypothetical protein